MTRKINNQMESNFFFFLDTETLRFIFRKLEMSQKMFALKFVSFVRGICN